MKDKRNARKSIAVILFAVMMMMSILAVVPMVGADSDVTSTTPPEGYEPETVESFTGGTEVLLIKDVNPWGYPGNEKALQELGKTYNVINSGTLATTDPSEYKQDCNYCF